MAVDGRSSHTYIHKLLGKLAAQLIRNKLYQFAVEQTLYFHIEAYLRYQVNITQQRGYVKSNVDLSTLRGRYIDWKVEQF